MIRDKIDKFDNGDELTPSQIRELERVFNHVGIELKTMYVVDHCFTPRSVEIKHNNKQYHVKH